MYTYNPNKISEVRTVKGLSKEDLASGSGVSITTVWNIEKGNIPHLKSLIAIVNFLKISITDVIEFEKDEATDEPAAETATAVSALNESNPNLE